jgi:signal transduction histidine kinase
MTSDRKARCAFASAVALLLVSALSTLFTFTTLKRDQRLVAHTQAVQGTIADAESATSRASRAVLGYALSGNEAFLPEYETGAALLSAKLQNFGELTRDNPREQSNDARLEALAKERMHMWQCAVQSKKSGQLNAVGLNTLSAQTISLAAQMTLVTQAMKEEEARLLEQRRRSADRMLSIVMAVVITAFLAALLLFMVHYRLLRDQLTARTQAEQAAKESELHARQSQEAARSLSARLLQLQDEERRRFARELHDSLGQYLASLKMSLTLAGNANLHSAESLADSLDLVDECITETRTMSYLLHPPMLDEAGFASAAAWYIDGFAQRSGVKVTVDLDNENPRLPREVEMALFRILQESLTNIHKHAKSPIAEIALSVQPQAAILTIRDTGKGVPNEVLTRFTSHGNSTGVGLSGMRERVHELGGQLTIRSGEAGGTTVIAVIPFAEDANREAAMTISNDQKKSTTAA